MRNVAGALLLVSLIGGCASTPLTGTSTFDRLELHVGRSDGQAFTLVDGGRRVIDHAVSRGGRLVFELSMDHYISGCVALADANGRLLASDRQMIFLGPRADFQERFERREAVQTENDAAQQAERIAKARHDSLLQQLRSNAAYRNDACYMLSPRPAPPRPVAHCGSREECLQDGAAICFTQYLGVKGCGMALGEVRIPGLLSSPGCAAAAASLAGRKYGMDDAIVDLLHGLAEDTAKELLKSESLGDQAMGLIIGGLNEGLLLDKARECTNNFVKQQFAPLVDWSAQVEQIRAEPARLFASCQQDADGLSVSEQQLRLARSRSHDAAVQLQAVDSALEELRRQRLPIERCEL